MCLQLTIPCSCCASQMMQAPIVTLVRFWANHHLLDLVQRPVWRVVKGRSRSYVDAICAGAHSWRSCLLSCVLRIALGRRQLTSIMGVILLGSGFK